MNYVIAILVGYLLGCINPAYLIAKAKGFDIRTRGSLSAGASNAKITMGWPYFFIVLAYDLLKSVIAVLVIRHCFPETPSAAILAGTAAVYGHVFPFYLGFKGGKGYASFIGLMLAVDFRLAVIVILVGLLLAFLSNWIVAATLTCIIGFPIAYWLAEKPELLNVIFIVTASLLICLEHIPNYRRLVRHQEIGINKNYVGTKIRADSH